jgi:hypothetical protein
MKSAIIALTTLLLLGGCGTAPSKPSSLTAPDVKVYSQTERTEAIQEIEGGTCKVLVEIVKDCSVMRDQSRVLKNETKPKAREFKF